MLATPKQTVSAPVVARVVLAALALTLVGLLAAAGYYATRTPTQASAANIVYGDLLRLEYLHSKPHVIFRHRDRVYFDHLRRDWKYVAQPDTHGWVLTGLWYFMPATDAPASAGVARCTGVLGESCDKATEIFGQITTPAVTAVEIEVAGEWRRYDVSAPAFAVRLDGFTGAPSGYRWLDAGGNAVWTQAAVPPLVPGR